MNQTVMHTQRSEPQDAKSWSWYYWLWLVMACYIMGFGYFAWIDLYAPQSTKGLYRTHHSPFDSSYGFVVDPRPNQPMHRELIARAPSSRVVNSDAWPMLENAISGLIEDRTFREISADEMILAKDPDQKPILLIKKYRGEWVVFRPNIGIILSPEGIESTLSDPLVLRVK